MLGFGQSAARMAVPTLASEAALDASNAFGLADLGSRG